MKPPLWVAAALVLTAGAQDVVWNSPSSGSLGSMPLGNGDIGINLWVERDGDLMFYIGKTDAWDESARLLKLGLVRVRLSPSPFSAGKTFRQTLKVRTGEIEIVADNTTILVWVDANHPVIRMQVSSPRNIAMKADLENWRSKERSLTGPEAASAYSLSGGPTPPKVYPDTLKQQGGRITWYHRNERSPWGDMLKFQGVGSIIPRLRDPLLHRTFGGALRPTSRGSAQSHLLSVYLLTRQTETLAEWEQALTQTVERVDDVPIEEAQTAHRRWWRQFWERSWMRIGGTPESETVNRGYALSRFLAAASGRGPFPVKFNGSIFNVDYQDGKRQYDADYRRWGGPYWFQNTRHVYWPMLASGDWDEMQAFFRMYYDALPLARERTRSWFQHEGAFFPEVMSFWGTYPNSMYGWKREGKPQTYVESSSIRYYWSGSLELISMMIDYANYSGDQRFVRTMLLPFAEQIIRFYDKHYPREQGRVRFAPAQSLDTWQEAINPLPEIAGLRFVLGRLLKMSDLTNEQRIIFNKLDVELPGLPVTDVGGKQVLAAATHVAGKPVDGGNPELYAVFPYRLYGMGLKDLDMAVRTFENRRVKRTGGSSSDGIQAAYLGLAETARKVVVQSFTMRSDTVRFPGFVGSIADQIPDQAQGSAAANALQTMLLQCGDKRILLFPAWPKEWDVEFRLHAPMNTAIEGVYRAKKLERLKVTPASRAADIVLPAGWDLEIPPAPQPAPPPAPPKRTNGKEKK